MIEITAIILLLWLSTSCRKYLHLRSPRVSGKKIRRHGRDRGYSELTILPGFPRWMALLNVLMAIRLDGLNRDGVGSPAPNAQTTWLADQTYADDVHVNYGSAQDVVTGFVQNPSGGYYMDADGSLAISPSVPDIGAAINAAISASTKPFIRIPAATYNYVTPISSTKDTTIIGAGRGRTILNYTPLAGTAMTLNSAVHMTLKGFSLTGSGSGNPTTGIYLGLIQKKGWMSDFQVSGFGVGGQFAACFSWPIIGGRFTGNGYGIKLGENCNALKFDSTEFDANIFGVLCQGAILGVVFDGCIMEHNTVAEIILDSSAVGRPEGVVITGCYLETATAASLTGVWLQNTGGFGNPLNTMINSCRIQDYSIGIRVDAGEETEIRGNFFNGYTVLGTVPYNLGAGAKGTKLVFNYDAVTNSGIDSGIGTVRISSGQSAASPLTLTAPFGKMVGSAFEGSNSSTFDYRFTANANAYRHGWIANESGGNSALISTFDPTKRGWGIVGHNNAEFDEYLRFMGDAYPDPLFRGRRVTVRKPIEIDVIYELTTGAGVTIDGSLLKDGGADFASTTNTVRLPRMTTVQRDALTPVDGDLIYNTTTAKFQCRQSGLWVDFA